MEQRLALGLACSGDGSSQLPSPLEREEKSVAPSPFASKDVSDELAEVEEARQVAVDVGTLAGLPASA
jgi:hypothetical protein